MSRHLLVVGLLVLCVGVGCAQDGKPESVVLNGGFEWQGGWSSTTNTRRVPSDRGGMCLQIEGEAGVTQDLPTDTLRGTYTVAADLKAQDITPRGTGAGYAYVAVYQLAGNGQLVAFHDFGQASGTKDWQRFTYTFEIAPQAVTLSLRCGIFNAGGTAWFDNWTCVAGAQAKRLEEVDQINPAARPAQGTVAVLREPGLPAIGKPSDPTRLGKLLEKAGMTVAFLSAAELANPRVLRPDRFHLVVLPYGQAFPANARSNMIQYLHLGGSFISTGGYVFNKLLLPQNGRWIDENTVIAAELEEALKHSVLPDGGFEQTTDLPLGGTVTDGRWRRDHAQVEIVGDNPFEGKACARVTAPPDQQIDERKVYLDVKPESGSTYRVTSRVRTKDVTGAGFAYMAVYEYDADNKLLKHCDYAQVRGTHDWQQFSHDFAPTGTTARIFIKLGLYRASGTAWYDDVRLSKINRLRQQVMNTSDGDPGDGLGLASWQIGAFDAGFPLRRVARALPGEEQYLFAGAGKREGALSGWAAAGVQGYDNARWVELLDCRDRFGRKRGAGGALMLNYNGYYGGSQWAFFGAENCDLFDGSSPWLDAGFVNTARFMVRGVFLRNLKSDLALYRAGEPVKLQVTAQNNGSVPADCRVAFTVTAAGESKPLWTGQAQAQLPGGESRVLEATWQAPPSAASNCLVRAVLTLDGKPVDQMRSGFMLEQPAARNAGPTLRFRNNYFELNGRPIFLFGSDTYANTYNSSTENPWTWHLDHIASRDYGLNLYENLQFCNPPDWTYTDAQWRQFQAMAQSTQQEGLVFMPCQLCGHNVAIDEKTLEKQGAECAAYGEKMKPFPGVLYYLNGDFQFQPEDKAALTELWNGWLAEKYRTAEALKASWGDEMYGEWGKLAYPPPATSQWRSVRRCDQARFDIWLTQRWVQRNVRGVRSADTEHPITSEYYQRPYGGLDLILTIGDQDVSNIGYFDGKERDLENLPLILRLNDLRARGKSVALGEYGVKTHPAWRVENGAGGYHPQRTEEEQKQLFMAVGHYGLGMGASKVQNWCLRDASEWVFPWGIFYPNGRVPKDVAYWHRNQSLVWRFLRPRYVAPPVSVLLPDNLRLGQASEIGVETALNSFNTLVDLNAHFNTLNEHNLKGLSNDTKVLIWPSPLCPDDGAYRAVLQWVQQGGKLLVTGDLSLNWDRQRTRTERLKELCGVEFVRELCAPPQRNAGATEQVAFGKAKLGLAPLVEVRPAGAKVLASTAAGLPLLLSNTVGKGEVVYCTDGLELGARKDCAAALAALYASVLPAGNCLVGGPGLRLSHQPLVGGGEFVTAFNTAAAGQAQQARLGSGKVQAQLRVAGHYPCFVATLGRDKLVAAGASGAVTLDGKPLLSGSAQSMCVSLDGQSLPQSAGVLLCPMGAGTLSLRSARKWQDPVIVLGDLEQGKWRTLQTVGGLKPLTLDEDTMTCLALVCERKEVGKFTGVVTKALLRPWEIEGY